MRGQRVMVVAAPMETVVERPSKVHWTVKSSAVVVVVVAGNNGHNYGKNNGKDWISRLHSSGLVGWGEGMLGLREGKGCGMRGKGLGLGKSLVWGIPALQWRGGKYNDCQEYMWYAMYIAKVKARWDLAMARRYCGREIGDDFPRAAYDVLHQVLRVIPSRYQHVHISGIVKWYWSSLGGVMPIYNHRETTM